MASPADAADAPPPNPPHKGEGLKRLSLPIGTTARARHLRKNMTVAERHLWRAIRTAFPDHHWRKQVPLGPYFADFCSHAARLIIEVDGGQHADAVDQDRIRTRFIEAQGYRVLRFWNNDVSDNIDGVLEVIALARPPLPLGEVRPRERSKGEGNRTRASRSPSPSQPPAGPHPLPRGEGKA